MVIFNSLGSNYSRAHVLRAFGFRKGTNYRTKLENYLSKKYLGKALLFEKGREALEYGLKSLSLPKNSKVAITGFTCFAVYEAVVKAGLEPVYLDIEAGTVNFAPSSLKKAVKSEKRLRAVVLQNTLGFPQAGNIIRKYCNEHNLVLIEDLAHSVGTIYKDRTRAGSLGDLVVLSFSQDKLVDGVTGGALIWKKGRIHKPKYDNPETHSEIRYRLYPLLTFVIRNTYSFGLGKMLHHFLKKLDILSGPMDTRQEGYHRPLGWNARLTLERLKNLNPNLKHRLRIALIYHKNINPKLLCEISEDDIRRSSNIRFPIKVNERDKLVKLLRAHNIFVSDIWYDSPVAPIKSVKRTNYSWGNCPVSEEMSGKILNLPTHMNVSENDAQHISAIINQWQK